MKKINSILWGIALIAVSGLLILNALGIATINIFFDGWWTLFIIVPCLIGLFTDSNKTGNIIGLCIGGFLLLSCQDIVDFETLVKLIVPVIVLIFGVSLIFKGVFGNKSQEIIKKIKANGEDLKSCIATFSGQNVSYDNEVFKGAELTAIFGGIKCDLRNAVIESDVVINATSIFGGIDILVPDTVNVKISSTSIFGGVENKKNSNSTNNLHTVYVNGVCVFGGVDIK